MGVQDRAPTASIEPEPLSFGLEVGAKNAALSLEACAPFGWVHLDALELEVRLRGDEPAESNPAAYQSRRSLARQATMRMTQSDLDSLVLGRGAQLAAVGVDELSLRAMDSYVSMVARVRAGGQVAELSARIYLDASGNRLRLIVDEARTYGFLPTPAPLIAHTALTALLGPGRWSAVRGLSELELAPLDALLWHTMPPLGWRLPSTGELVIADIRCQRGEVLVHFGPSRARRPHDHVAELLDAHERFRAAEELLRSGEISGALRAYRAELAARGAEQPFLIDRILAVASSQPEFFVDAVELARQALGRWPDYAPAHNALANIATAQNDGLEAANRFQILAGSYAAVGDDDAASKAALAGARLLRRLSPAESTPLYELVLEHNPGEPEATEALTERYRDESRWRDLIALIRGRIGGAADPRAQARDHQRLAEILDDALGDLRGARSELVAATRLDPHSGAALESLAEIESKLGNPAEALRALDAAAALHGDRGDLRAEARALERGAQLSEAEGDDEAAEARYRAALDRVPNDAGALRGAAGAASRRGRWAEAAELWRMLLLSTTDGAEAQAECSYELGACLLEDGDTEGARPALERAVRSPNPSVAADARALLAEIHRADGELEDAAGQLEEAIEALGDAEHQRGPVTTPPVRLQSRAAELCLLRAHILEALGRTEDATADYHRAFDLAADRMGTRREAARALLDRAAETGDRDGQSQWIDALLESEPSDRERSELLLSRARLALAADRPRDAADDVGAALEGTDSDELAHEALSLKAEIARADNQPIARAEALEARAAMSDSIADAIAASLEAAEAWLDGERTSEALAAAERAVTDLDNIGDELGDVRDSWRLRAHRARTEAAWSRREFGAVRESCEIVLGVGLLDPATRAELTFRLAVALEHGGDDNGAVERYDAVIADDSAPPELKTRALRQLAEFHERLGHHAIAADAFCRLAEEAGDGLPDSARADAWYRAAELYRKHQGRGTDAERCLEEALRLAPAHMPALDALETLRRDSDDYERVAVILGRKIAATSRHPNRQKSLLVRLAALHETILGRIDVARETYNRALEIDPDYRPALRFIAADARRHGRVDEAARTLHKLSGTLPEDADLADDPASLRSERAAAALELAALAERQRTDETIDQLAEKALRRNQDREPDDRRLGVALEALYRRTHDWRELADQLARPGGDDPVARELERAEILWRQLDDPTAALLAIRGARDRHPDDPQLAEYETVLEEVSASTDTDAGPGFGREVAAAIAEAREARARGETREALGHLDAIAGPAAPDDLLMLRAELREAVGQWDRAASDLTLLRRRAASAVDLNFEHRLCRKLAALTAEKLGDGIAALALYERALEIDPDDLAAAEACVSIYERRGDRAAKIPALERVLEIARRTGAGPQTQAGARRELASFAAAEGRLDRALDHLEEALALAPEDEASLRSLAQVYADRGDLEKQAETLRLLAGSLANRAGGLSPNAGELYLELADLYYDKLGDPGRGRASMLAAARAFGDGSRSRSILRLLASEAGGEGDSETVIRALEAVGPERRSATDLKQLARAYQRLGRDHRAVEVLVAARGASRLDDEGAMLLLGLYRQLGRKRELASSLERGASEAPPAIASTRLMEALSLFENTLDDPESAERVRRQLDQLAAAHADGDPDLGLGHRPTPEELERAAEAAASGDETAVAADLLAQALGQRARGLARGGHPIDATTRQTLDNLRALARRDRHYEALTRGLLAASAVETDRQSAATLLREAAQVRRQHLHDTRGAADALARALALLPDDDILVAELDATLREAGDFSQLASAYELHLGALSGKQRSQPLIELARLYRDVFREPRRAMAYLTEAIEVAPERLEELDRELAGLERATEPGQPEPDDSEPRRRSSATLLELAAELEEAEQLDAAIAQCERAAALAGREDESPAPALERLERLYAKRDDWGAVSEVLGRMAGATEDASARAAIWFRRANLYRDVLHREAEAYRCLKEAHANDPDNGTIAHALRSVSMARGEWALAAELLYREIAAAETDVDRGALYLELAMIYDEKLLDVDAAMVNYEQALTYDPEIPAAPQPLARLYELRGRHAEAAEMYELAAARARTDVDRGRLLRQAGMSAEHGGAASEARRLYGLAAVAGTTDDHHKAQVALARLGGDATGLGGRIRMLEARLAEIEAPAERAEIQRQLLELATAAGDNDSAMRYAKLLLDSDRTDVSAFVALKEGAAEAGDWQQVASLLSSRAAAVDDSAEQAALYFELGRAYEEDLGDLNAAVGAYEQALAADTRHPGALEALAEITYKKNDWLRAYQIYQRLDPEGCSMPADVIALRQGEIAEALGREVEACDAFAEAVRLFPASRPALTALARTARRVGDLDRAVAATRALLELAPATDVGATTRVRGELAALLAQSGDITGAIYYYEMVVSEEPKAAGALAQLLDLYSEQGDYQGAARALRSLISLTGDAEQRADLLYRLGELYRTQLDDPDLAADAYLKAVDLAPQHVPVLRRLLEYYFRVGDDRGMVEVGGDLSRAGGLAHAGSGKENLARLMLLAGVHGEWNLVVELGEWFGVEALERLVRGLLDCARAERDSWPPEALAAAGAGICARFDIDGRQIYERICELADQGDRAAERLRDALAS